MLIEKEEFVSKFSERIRSTKKISNVDGVEDVLTRIYYTLERFNSLKEFTVSIGGRQLSDILIADEWKDFIVPESVRLDPTDLKTSNLLLRNDWVTPANVGEKNVKYVESLSDFDPDAYMHFINDQSTIRSYFKSDLNSNITNLAVLRANKSLSDVIPIIAVKIKEGELKCRSLDEPYIPLQLVSGLDCLFRTDYFNTPIKTLFSDYLTKKVIV
jgi:hypothetical protein